MQLLQLRVEYAYDQESQNWSFRVPSLGIVGGAETRKEAEDAAIEAIGYALEDDQEIEESAEAEVRYLQLAVQP
jgi:predicted RNase H-like HicB family nuclease